MMSQTCPVCKSHGTKINLGTYFRLLVYVLSFHFCAATRLDDATRLMAKTFRLKYARIQYERKFTKSIQNFAVISLKSA